MVRARKIMRPRNDGVDREMAVCRFDVEDEYGISNLKGRMHSNMTIARVENPASIFYGAIDPRRRQEYADGGMVAEDPTAIANLPTRFIHGEYPRAPYYYGPIHFVDTTDE